MPFILDRPNSKKDTYIFLHEYFADGRLKYSTGEKIHPHDWKGRISKATRIVLGRIEAAVASMRVDAKLTGKPLTKAYVATELDKLLNRSKPSNFFEVIDQIIDDRRTGKVLTKQGKRFSSHTIKGYVHSRDNLYYFDPKMRFENITLDTYEKLIAYFNKNNDHALNSLGKIIKNWKVFMKAAYKAGVHTNKIFDHDDFRVPSEDTVDVYLSEKELSRIYKHNFPNKTLDRVRDWFVIDCYCGLRICDIQALDKKNLVEGFIRIVNEKTDTKVMVPFHPFVKQIIKKWKGLPPKVTDQEMNRSLKDICQLCGIKDKVLYSVTKGGVRKDYHLEKWEMISNHSARRSFITNLLRAGIPHTQVMRLAGIKKLQTLQKYDKLTVEENAEIMKGHKFFR